MVSAHHGAVAYAEDLHDRVSLVHRGGVDVEVVALIRVHFLAVQRSLDREKAVAERRGPLERERIGCLLHLLLRVAGERLVAPFEEEDTFLDGGAVFVPSRRTDARSGAALQVIEQAGTAAGQCGGRDGASASVLACDDRQLAGAVRKELLQKVERLVHRLRVRKRTEIARRPIAERALPEDPREILTEGDLHIGIRLVVFEPDVVAGPVLLDEIVLEEEGFRDAVGEHVLEPLGALHHSDKANVEARAEVVAHPVAEYVGLTDVHHASLGVLEQVDPRFGRERGDLGL